MFRWRLSLSLLLGLTVALPLAWPLRELFDAGAWPDAGSLPRLLALAANTSLLLLGTLTLALPLGTLLAILFERTDLPGRRLLLAGLVIPLFVPLPILLSGWQAGREWLPASEWSPWSHGLRACVFFHALAGLPWVVLLVGLGLRGAERDLEEDALTIRPPDWVLRHVTLRRALPAVAAAALWLAVQTAGEITVTDLLQVRTFAEEVYTQLVGPELHADPIGRAVAASLLGVVAVVAAVGLLARQAGRLAPAGVVGYRPPVTYPLGRWRWPLAALVFALVAPLVLVPTAGLVWRAGLAGLPPSWSWSAFVRQMAATTRTDAGLLVRAPVVAVVSGTLCAGLALVACWLARESRGFRAALLVLLAAAWAMPGPIVGLGLKGAFAALIDASDGFTSIPARLLWHGPSLLPLIAVALIRFLPFAAALVWPAVRALPRDLLEAARMDGASPSGELLEVVWPLTRRAVLRAALAVAILSLGELSAGKLVSTPEAEGFAEVIWTQMHYGLGADLAAKCFLLLGGVAAGAIVLAGMTFPGRREKSAPLVR
jgi:iron(III) transport system permease protein